MYSIEQSFDQRSSKLKVSLFAIMALEAAFCLALFAGAGEAHAALAAGSVDGVGNSSVQTTAVKKPAKVTISSLKSSSVGNITIQVKKATGARGYQYVIARNKGMTKSIKGKVSYGRSYTFQGLAKGKTYYAKVRAYKISKGKVVWGPWSAVKSVKVKASKPPADGIYSVWIEGCLSTARISGNTITLKRDIYYYKNTKAIAEVNCKMVSSPKTFTLDSKTQYGIDDTDAGVMRKYSKAQFSKLLNSKSSLLPFVMVWVKSGKVVFVGTMWF